MGSLITFAGCYVACCENSGECPASKVETASSELLMSCISQGLRSKGAENIDKDTAEETGYWKKPEVPPVMLTLFIICLLQGIRNRVWALLFFSFSWKLYFSWQFGKAANEL